MLSNEEWLIEVDRLEEFFKVSKLPEGTLHLSKYAAVSNLKSYLNTNIVRARNSPGSNWQQGCIFRLHQLEKYLLENN